MVGLEGGSDQVDHALVDEELGVGVGFGDEVLVVLAQEGEGLGVGEHWEGGGGVEEGLRRG